MNAIKKEKIRKLYELERLVYSKGSKKKIKKLREELNCQAFDKMDYQGFKPELYLSLKKKNPKMTDKQLSEIMGISTRTLAKGKREYGISNRRNNKKEDSQKMA